MNAQFTQRDTKAALQTLAVKDCSRSLYFDRYSRPDLAKDERQQYFTDGFSAHRSTARVAAWAAALPKISADVLYAQAQSRLMVNMAGGVMENAGLCLDRFGLPYLPGSAVKGCARRAALAALHEWCETGRKPGGTEDKDNLFARACAPFSQPSEMLAAIARIFGWGEQEWSDKKKDARFISDFAWAFEPEIGVSSDASQALTGRNVSAQGNALSSDPDSMSSPEGAAQPRSQFNWSTIRLAVVCQIARELNISLRDDDSSPWKRLPSFAGSVSFLPAHPVDLPGDEKIGDLPVPPLGKLELDVVTVHHKKYYASPERPDDPASVRAWERDWGTAPDIEEPVPNIFPAVAAGHVFAFALAPLRRSEATLVQHARVWLACGLSTFGVGAKTNAGYGWFEDVSGLVSGHLLLRRSVNEIQSRAAKFAELSDDERLEFILSLATTPDACRVWRVQHPETAKDVETFAQAQDFELP